MSRPRVTFSNHALKVMRKRNITIDEVCDVFENYSIRTIANEYRGVYRPDQYMYKNGSLAVVTHEEGQNVHIITVLLNRPDRWTDADARARHRTSPPAA